MMEKTEEKPELVIVRLAAVDADSARKRYERAIRDAHPACTVREIAAAAGLSRSRIHQIIAAGNGAGPHASVRPPS